MAGDKYIDELSAAGTLDGTEKALVFQSDDTVYVALSVIKTYFDTLGVTPRFNGTASAAAITPNADTTDYYAVTALAVNLTINAPVGAPNRGQRLTISIKDAGVSKTLSFNPQYRFGTTYTAPASTTVGKIMYLHFMLNQDGVSWDIQNISNGI